MNKFDSRLKVAYIRIHQAIHDPGASTVELYSGGSLRPVHRMGNLRAVTYDDFTFVEQNPYKSTEFAKQARAGKRITWGIPVGGGVWLYIDDDIAEAFDNKSKQKVNEITNSSIPQRTMYDDGSRSGSKGH